MYEDSVGRALARAAMSHRARAAALLSAIDLHPGQEFLLATLGEHGPCAVGEIADHLGVEQPTITKMVRRLEPSGVIERSLDPDDGRRTLISLTAEGRARLDQARELWHRLDQITTARLDTTDRAELLRLLRKVRAALEHPDQDAASCTSSPTFEHPEA